MGLIPASRGCTFRRRVLIGAVSAAVVTVTACPVARLRGLGNVNAVPADLTSMTVRRLIWLIVLAFCFAFVVTAAAGPVVAVVACAGVLIYALAVTRRDAARRAEAAEAEAAEAETEAKAAVAEAVVAEAEAVVAAARLRLLGGDAS